ncbi:MAG: glycerol kinase GlpK [Coriobacteriia bacterium]|nr:glycerol kinase GlpK [Coriobacteriia bacterium]
MGRYVVALDQGTTSSRAVLIDRTGEVAGVAQSVFPQHFPRPGWVEHDPKEILASQLKVLTEVLVERGITVADLDSVGITNQRETTIVWDRATGEPVYNAIVWQCRRTAELVERICCTAEIRQRVTELTGLIPDAYYSASKLAWILENVPGVRERAEAGELLFGTVDTWLIWNLTRGAVHATDPTNASRTMLFDIRTGKWSSYLCELFGIPESLLPEVRPSSGDFGVIDHPVIKGGIPIRGVAGDQQSALFGQCCFAPGGAKATFGTGCFLLMHTGAEPCSSEHGLVTTVAASAPGTDHLEYALEGSVFMAGALMQWLRDGLGLIEDVADSERVAQSVEDSAGVYVVPAFTGLGAPYWDADARGAIFGLTRGAQRAHLVRACLEAQGYQVNDVLVAMQKDAGVKLTSLAVDGGACRNDFLCSFCADAIDASIVRPGNVETTALGAAYLAGLASGFWSSTDEIRSMRRVDHLFEPTLPKSRREELLAGWADAVRRTRTSESI